MEVSLLVIVYLSSSGSHSRTVGGGNAPLKLDATAIKHQGIIIRRLLPCMRLLCQSMLTLHAPDVVNALRTVGHCGGSEVKKII